MGRARGPHRPRHRRPLPGAARRERRGRRPPARRRRPLLPSRRGLRHDRRRREPEGREHRGHPPRDRARRGGQRRLLSRRQLDRRRRPLQGHLARGHVRGGRGPRHPPLLPHQARVREGRAGGVRRPLARLPPGHRRRPFRDRRDGQGRRPLLLLQADPAAAQRDAAVDADDRRRGQGDQPRPRRLRRGGDGPHRPSARARRPGVPPDRPEPEVGGPGHQPLRRSRPRAEDADAPRPEDVRRHPGRGAQRDDDAAPGQADPQHGPRRPRDPRVGADLRQLPDELRLEADAEGARGHRTSACRRSRPTPTSSGTTGSATSTPTSSRTAR